MDILAREKHSSLYEPYVSYEEKEAWIQPERCFTWVGSDFTRTHQTWLERLSRNKHSSLWQTLVNYGRKSFITFSFVHTLKNCVDQVFESCRLIKDRDREQTITESSPKKKNRLKPNKFKLAGTDKASPSNMKKGRNGKWSSVNGAKGGRTCRGCKLARSYLVHKNVQCRQT
jgi:hypothetical protein